jgi:hypothetical protein
MPVPDKIAMENVNSLGRVARVDADKYHATRICGSWGRFCTVG